MLKTAWGIYFYDTGEVLLRMIKSQILEKNNKCKQIKKLLHQMKIIQDQQKKIETTKVENKYLQFITDSKLPFLTYYVLRVIKSERPRT